MSYRVAVIAGEASGDMHGAALAQNLRSLDPDIVLEGIGGERMKMPESVRGMIQPG